MAARSANLRGKTAAIVSLITFPNLVNTCAAFGIGYAKDVSAFPLAIICLLVLGAAVFEVYIVQNVLKVHDREQQSIAIVLAISVSTAASLLVTTIAYSAVMFPPDSAKFFVGIAVFALPIVAAIIVVRYLRFGAAKIWWWPVAFSFIVAWIVCSSLAYIGIHNQSWCPLIEAPRIVWAWIYPVVILDLLVMVACGVKLIIDSTTDRAKSGVLPLLALVLAAAGVWWWNQKLVSGIADVLIDIHCNAYSTGMPPSWLIRLLPGRWPPTSV